MWRAERATQVIFAPEGLMLIRKSGHSRSAEDRYSAQTRLGRHNPTGEPLGFHRLRENRRTEAKSQKAKKPKSH